MLNRAFEFFSLQQQTRRNIVIGLNVAPSISITILGYLLKASLAQASHTISTASASDSDPDALLKAFPMPEDSGLKALLSDPHFVPGILKGMKETGHAFQESICEFVSDRPLEKAAGLIVVTATMLYGACLIQEARIIQQMNRDRGQESKLAKERTASSSVNVSKQSMFAKTKYQPKQKERDVTDEEMANSVFGKPHNTTDTNTRRRRR